MPHCAKHNIDYAEGASCPGKFCGDPNYGPDDKPIVKDANNTGVSNASEIVGFRPAGKKDVDKLVPINRPGFRPA